MSGSRLPSGGRIDRTRPLRFSFDGRNYDGYAGDTLASALLANGVEIVGRSFKYHRPRGLYAAGAEEMNALVQLESGALTEPNRSATGILLYDGLSARSVNTAPDAARDWRALFDRFGRFLPAGFYYKTFMWPHWRLFEGPIRRAAGLGTAPEVPDPDLYAQVNTQCELLVVGTGPAGLAAALAAAPSGAQILVLEAEHEPGGSSLWTADEALASWCRDALTALRARANVRILAATTAFGYYDHNLVAAVERPASGRFRERLWKIRADRVILASGAIERPLVFPGNDLPGVMLASAVARYARQFGVKAGERAVIVTNNDEAGIDDLRAAGIDIAAVIDVRDEVGPLRAGGRRRVTAVETRHGRIACDLVCVAGGWSPTVHLFSQSGGSLRFCNVRLMFVPDRAVQAIACAGAANGTLAAAAAIAEGWTLGGGTPAPDLPDLKCGTASRPPAIWSSPSSGKAFVDYANDVTKADIALAARENYVSVEHLKRYTTLGMGPDQGKTSNVNGLVLLGEATARAPGAVGTTRFRPPYTPVSFGALVGARTGERFRPRKQLPAHCWHAGRGAAFEDYGWQRPDAYPRFGESIMEAARREAAAVRQGAGLFDASPIGKIEVRGTDAARFLDFIYVQTMSTLKVGRIRYGLMLDENGVVIDDGVAIRLADDHFLLHPTSAAADRIATWLDEWLQCEFPAWQVTIVNVTAQWGTVTLSGPEAWSHLDHLLVDIDLDPVRFPHLSFMATAIGEVPARIARVSFTGEASYEISVPASYTASLLEALAENPAVTPYGIEALTILRMEKGYLHVGTDTDGTTVPADIGFGTGIAKKKSDFVGRRSLLRHEASREDRLQLVGLSSDRLLPVGAHATADMRPTCPSDGYVTSACESPTLGRPIALALIRRGRSRIGERVRLYDLGRFHEAQIVNPVFVDPEGVRLR